MQDQANVTISKDNPRERSVSIEGNTIHLKRRDPHGLIYLQLATGVLPEKYSGEYTTTDAAMADVYRYQEDRRLAAIELQKLTKEDTKKKKYA